MRLQMWPSELPVAEPVRITIPLVESRSGLSLQRLGARLDELLAQPLYHSKQVVFRGHLHAD